MHEFRRRARLGAQAVYMSASQHSSWCISGVAPPLARIQRVCWMGCAGWRGRWVAPGRWERLERGGCYIAPHRYATNGAFRLHDDEKLTPLVQHHFLAVGVDAYLLVFCITHKGPLAGSHQAGDAPDQP
jgi:hypothetical protein